MYKSKTVVLTITSCKRLETFLQTIRSYSKNIIDKDLIDFIIHYDDSSCYEDIKAMHNELKVNFPDKNIIQKIFHKEDIKSEKRHMSIMKNWKIDIENLNIDYVFHLEDDWLFEHHFKISEAIDILESRSDIALIGFSQVFRNTPSDFKKPKEIGDFWEWIYLPDRPTQDLLFMDYDEMSYYDNGYWCYFINWPYFSFRPGIHDVKKLSQLENFNEESDSFELEFAKRFADKFHSYNHKKRICKHIGDISSYSLNKSKR